MKAKVVLINQSRGMIGAQTNERGYVIFELLGGYDIEIGDVVSHNDFYSMGSEDYKNLTKNELMSVYVQNICSSLKQARQQCFL